MRNESVPKYLLSLPNTRTVVGVWIDGTRADWTFRKHLQNKVLKCQPGLDWFSAIRVSVNVRAEETLHRTCILFFVDTQLRPIS